MLVLLMMPNLQVFAASGSAGVEMSGTTVTGYTGTGGAVTIPKEATAIAANAFANKTLITAITIPSSVTSIGDKAFANCTGLSSITVPGSVQTFGTGVFSGCNKLSSASFQASVGSIPTDTFNGCSSLTSIAISSSISSIGDRAFKDCVSLSSMAIPEGVTNIGSGAFSGNSSLTAVSIPASCTSIASDAFDNCGSLTTINVASGNGSYASDGGCLYNASYTKLLKCPPGKGSVALNSGVKIIGSGAFGGCNKLSSLEIPYGATEIEGGSLSNSAITSLIIPSSVNSIGSQNFTPDIIYGYLDTEADRFAAANGYVFYGLDGNGLVGDEDNETADITIGTTNSSNTIETDNGKKNGSGKGNKNNKDNKKEKTDSSVIGGDSHNTGNKPSNNTTTTTTVGNGTTTYKPSTGAYQTTTSTYHEKDSTPKTGQYLNERLWIVFALVLIAVAFLILAKKKRNE